MASERDEIEKTIVQLEAQRATLGDAAVDTAIKALRQQLDVLTASAIQQRKLVTVLFADLFGFTAMSETLDAEVVNEIMGKLWLRLDAVVETHGGLVARHLGDALMALWGVEAAREDDPEQAIRAALEIQSLMKTGNLLDNAPSLQMRIGINTGPALVGGTTTTGEFNIMGDTVNVASRLEHAAPVGNVLVSHDTYRHVRGLFDVEAWEPLAIRGKKEPMRVYLVQAAKERAFRVSTRGVRGIETRTIGREAELKILQGAFVSTAHTGTAHLVTVAGDAGVGKSRLLYEFDTNWLEVQPGGVVTLRGRATSDMTGVGYSIFRDILRLHCDIFDSDPAATVLQKFRAGLSGALDADRADIVGHFIGFDFSGSEAVQKLLGNPSFGELAKADLVRYLRHLASDAPLVIFLDDIHWADMSSLDLVQFILNSLSNLPLFVVCLTRLDLFEQHPEWGVGGSAYTRIDLKPLSTNDSRALVAEILRKVEDIPTRLRDLIVDNSAGNPYYAEELIGILIEDGIIVRGEDTWRVEQSRLTDLRIPPTLTGILQARLDGLPVSEKEAMQRASVVGRQFWGATVDSLVEEPHDHAETLALLDAAASRDLIFRQNRSVFSGTPQYIFKHAILHEVTYETVLLKMRRVYHAQVARWLEANAGERIDEYLNLIALHYERAGDTAHAVQYLRQSAEELKKQSAFSDATKAIQHAVELTSPDDKAARAAFLVELGDLHEKIGDYAAAQEHLDEALALARSASDPQSLVKALVWTGIIAFRQGNLDEAETYNAEALALAREIQTPFYTAMALMSTALVTYLKNDLDVAREYQSQALEIFRQQGNQYRIAQSLNNLGIIAKSANEDDLAKAYYVESLELGRAVGDRSGVARTLNNLGQLDADNSHYESAISYYQQSKVTFEDIGDKIGLAVVLANLGHTAASLGEVETSRRHYQEALSAAVSAGSAPVQLEILAGIARLHADSEEHERAAQLIGLVVNHPAYVIDVEDIAAPVLNSLKGVLLEQQLEAALGQGAALDLDTVIDELLAVATP